MKRIAKLIASIALGAAKAACGSASQWNMYQPKEPAMLKHLK